MFREIVDDMGWIYKGKAWVRMGLTCTLLKLDAEVSFWPMSSQVSEVCYSKLHGRVFANARRGGSLCEWSLIVGPATCLRRWCR